MTRGSRIRTPLLLSLAVAAAVVLSFRGIYEPDLWWHLAQGREDAAGRLVHANVFNFIYPDFSQPYTPWLFDLGGYLAWRLAGGAGIQLAQASLLALTFVLLYFACRQRATASAALTILLLGFFVIEPRAIPRPHLELYPDTRIFQDGRLQAVPPEHFLAIIRASRSQPEWNALVAGVDWAVISLPRPNQLSGAGQFPVAEWATVYWDEAVEVLVRRGGGFGALVERYEYALLRPESDAFVLAERLDGPDGARLRAEARRNMADNSDGFAATAVSCLADDAAACQRLDRFAIEQPRFRDSVRRVREMRR